MVFIETYAFIGFSVFWSFKTVPSTLLVKLLWLSFPFYIGSSSLDNQTADVTQRSPDMGIFLLVKKVTLKRFVCFNDNSGKTPICFRHSVRQQAIKRLPSQLFWQETPCITKSGISVTEPDVSHKCKFAWMQQSCHKASWQPSNVKAGKYYLVKLRSDY